MQEVAMHARSKVLIEVDDIFSQIVGYQQSILDQQVRPHPSHLLNINITLIILNFILIIY
jgi:hypothetical protein